MASKLVEVKPQTGTRRINPTPKYMHRGGFIPPSHKDHHPGGYVCFRVLPHDNKLAESKTQHNIPVSRGARVTRRFDPNYLPHVKAQ